MASRPQQPCGQLSFCRVHPRAVLLLFSCLWMEAEVWVASFNLSYCSAPCRGAGRFIADPVFWFCLLTSVLTLPSAIRNSVPGPTPGLQSFSPGKRFWSKLGGERATALSVLPYCNWVGCPCRWTGEMCSSSEGVQRTYVVLYVSDFPTLLSHPSCPCIYLPPPQAGTSAKKKGDIRVSEPQSPLQERRWMEQISSGLLSRSRCRCWGQTPCQHLLWELSVRRVIFDATSCAGTKVFLWVWEASLPASKAKVSKW